MRKLILIAFLVVPGLALAQSGSGSAASGSAGSDSATTTPEGGAQAGMPKLADPTPAELRKTCADALNADPNFAQAIVETINKDTARQHLQAADAIAKNEKHVLLAYAAMWVMAAAFLIFMWRRQQGLKLEIAQLKRDLEVALK